MRIAVFVGSVLVVQTCVAAPPVAHRDLAYQAGGTSLQSLDVYAPPNASKLPVAIWIHGGGWRQGDKAGVSRKPAAFTERGMVLVSINYRLFPEVTIEEMMGDVARAIRWVRDHAAEYGGDPDRLVVLGHSAGAHLAALVCTDDRYLNAAGVPLSAIKGCVPVDVGVYDIRQRIADVGAPATGNFAALFGDTAEKQRQFSPAEYVAADKSIPAFLILYVADREENRAQAELFAGKLRASGVPAEIVAAEGKTHGTIATELGLPDDVPTQALYAFFDRVLAPTP